MDKLFKYICKYLVAIIGSIWDANLSCRLIIGDNDVIKNWLVWILKSRLLLSYLTPDSKCAIRKISKSNIKINRIF